MPIAVSQTAGQAGGGVVSLTTGSVTPGGSDRYTMAVSASRGDGPLTARYNGSTGTLLTADTQRTISFTGGRGRTFRLLGGPTAATTGYATYDGDPGDIRTTAVSFLFLTGAHQTTPADTVETVEDVNGDAVTTVPTTISLTGRDPGQFVAVALELSQFGATVALSSITAANGATTVREPRYGTLTDGSSVATAWLTGVADGDGNVTLAANVTKESGAVLGWWLEAYSLNEAAGGGSNALAGGATASGSATGALTRGVSLAGAAVAVGTAAGQLQKVVPLQGAAIGGSVAAGQLSLGIGLQGAALAQVLAAAQLSRNVPLAGAAVGSGAGSATLSLQIRLTAAAVAGALAGASLSLGVSLAGAAVAGAQAQASLEGARALAGAAVAAGLANASLSKGVLLQGSAVASGQAAGQLSGSVPLAGNAVGSAQAGAALTVVVTLSGQALAAAAATGQLAIAVRVAGGALASALAGATLTVLVEGGEPGVFDAPQFVQLVVVSPARIGYAGGVVGARRIGGPIGRRNGGYVQ